MHALDLAVEWLEQTYTPITNKTSHRRYEYAAPGLEFECRLVYDPSGLILGPDVPRWLEGCAWASMIGSGGPRSRL